MRSVRGPEYCTKKDTSWPFCVIWKSTSSYMIEVRTNWSSSLQILTFHRRSFCNSKTKNGIRDHRKNLNSRRSMPMITWYMVTKLSTIEISKIILMILQIKNKLNKLRRALIPTKVWKFKKQNHMQVSKIHQSNHSLGQK